MGRPKGSKNKKNIMLDTGSAPKRVVAKVVQDTLTGKLHSEPVDASTAAAETPVLTEGQCYIGPSNRKSGELRIFLMENGEVVEKNKSMDRDRLLKIVQEKGWKIVGGNTIASIASEHRTPINERFEFMGTMFAMIAEGMGYGGIVSGPGGVGKSYTAHKVLRSLGYLPATLTSAGMFNEATMLLRVGDRAGAAVVLSSLANKVDMEAAAALLDNPKQKLYFTITGRCTDNELYSLLYAGRHFTILVDDVNNVLESDQAVQYIMAATDTKEVRIISNAKYRKEDDPTPSSFEFTGSLLVLTNLELYDKNGKPNIYEPLLDRFQPVDLSMTQAEKLDRVRYVLDTSMDSFIAAQQAGLRERLTPEVVMKALGFIEEHLDEVANISFRVLIKTLPFVVMGKMDAALMSLRQGK